ncbi:hypothetical protein GQ457_18G000740 [Hibiscus cannabinus]
MKLQTLNDHNSFSEGIQLIAFLCWSLWKARNGFVFSAFTETPIDTWMKAQCAFSEFSALNEQKSTPPSVPLTASEQWIPPGPGFVKVNVDASVDLVRRKASAAVIFRDEEVRFLGGTSASFIPSSIAAAEAYAVRLGTCAAIEAGFSKVIVESDNAGVISRINSKTLSAWESAAIEGDILGISAPFLNFFFSAVKRACNKAADWVANVVRKGRCPDNWQSVLPHSLRLLL